MVTHQLWEGRDHDHPGQLALSTLVFETTWSEREQLRRVCETTCESPLDAFVEASRKVLTDWIHHPSMRRVHTVGLSVLNTQLLPAIFVARALKRLRPDIRVVVGGFLCTPEGAKQLLEFESCFDVAVVGEGEGALLDLIANDRDQRVPNTVIRIGGELRINPPRSNLNGVELDALPYPDYSWVDPATIRQFATELPILSSRGCWWNRCTFCSDIIHWKTAQSREVEAVVDELEAQSKKYRWHKFYFCDLAANTSKDRMNQFCDAIHRRGLTLQMSILMRQRRSITRAELQRLHQAGFRCIQFGLEAFSTSLLRKMGKGVTALDNVRLLKLAEESGVRIVSNIISEFPLETAEEVVETYELVKHHPAIFNRRTIPGLSPFRMRPGSSIESIMGREPFERLDTDLSRRLFPHGVRDRLPILEYAISRRDADSGFRELLWSRIGEAIARPHAPERFSRWYRVGSELIVEKFDWTAGSWQTFKLSSDLGILLVALSELRKESDLLRELNWDREALQNALSVLRRHHLVVSDGILHFSMVFPGNVQVPLSHGETDDADSCKNHHDDSRPFSNGPKLNELVCLE